MSAELHLKEYLENSTECSKRIRTILTILVVVTVLIFSGFLNSWQKYAWNSERIRFRQDYIKELKQKIAQLNAIKEQLNSSATEFSNGRVLPLLQMLPATHGSEACSKPIKADATREEKESLINSEIQCYEGAVELSNNFLQESIKAYVENAYLIRVPFFGVAFDINDLGAIGGLSLIVILLMLRLNLRNFIVSLRIGFKAARKARLYEDFYDILAGRQLFAFPPVEDADQTLYIGKTEAIWNDSLAKKVYEWIVSIFAASFLRFKKILWGVFEFLLWSDYKEHHSDPPPAQQPKKGWHSNPHPVLSLVPTWICLVPAIVHAAVVTNDFRSYEVGLVVNEYRTKTGFGFSLICLVVIFGLGCWCISKWIEIDKLWRGFNDKNLLTANQETAFSEVHSVNAAKDNKPKPVRPIQTRN